MKSCLFFLLFSSLFLFACSTSRKIEKCARKNILSDKALQTAHIGICVYDPSSGKYVYNYQADKYFVPASNTKLVTCFAAMKHLSDSLVGLRYRFNANGEINILPTGDPSLFHPDFNRHPVGDFFKANQSAVFIIDQRNWHEAGWGNGWSWNDYADDYMAERSPFPIYGNTVHFKNIGHIRFWLDENDRVKIAGLQIYPSYFKTKIALADTALDGSNFNIRRELVDNKFSITRSKQQFVALEIPFVTDGVLTAAKLLADTFHLAFKFYTGALTNDDVLSTEARNSYSIIHSQPTDSLLKPMMHRSDNFFAEQSLLMVSNEMLGLMNDREIIDTLLKTDFIDLPQKPRWVDGSGLSRYNLFSPEDFVAILNKMRMEFGMDRIQNILPTGGEGTLTNYYKEESGYIFAKTGSLSGVVALSGFLYTKSNKQLIFSILVNNHQASPTGVRRPIEKFLKRLREKY